MIMNSYLIETAIRLSKRFLGLKERDTVVYTPLRLWRRSEIQYASIYVKSPGSWIWTCHVARRHLDRAAKSNGSNDTTPKTEVNLDCVDSVDMHTSHVPQLVIRISPSTCHHLMIARPRASGAHKWTKYIHQNERLLAIWTSTLLPTRNRHKFVDSW